MIEQFKQKTYLDRNITSNIIINKGNTERFMLLTMTIVIEMYEYSNGGMNRVLESSLIFKV